MDRTDHIFLLESPYMDRTDLIFLVEVYIWTTPTTYFGMKSNPKPISQNQIPNLYPKPNPNPRVFLRSVAVSSFPVKADNMTGVPRAFLRVAPV